MQYAGICFAFASPLLAVATDVASCAEPDAAELEAQEVLLLQVESNVRRTLRSDHQPARGAREDDHGRRQPLAGWFGGFAEAESTFQQDGVAAHIDLNSEKRVESGWAPGRTRQAHERNARGQEWFHESPSAGGLEAWQSHYPAVDGSMAGNRHVRDNPWRYTLGGWVQDYLPGDGNGPAGPPPASWFDSRADQYDGFGRQMTPHEDNPHRFMGWEERSVNTTLECADPGCNATVHLQAFDGLTERGTNCRLSVVVRPTDFDEEHSRERVDLISANGRVLTQDCNPRARGCNETASRPLYHCIASAPMDDIIDDLGSIVLVGRITPMVDECPYEGNLLAGLAMVTCLVSPIPENTTTTTTTPPPLEGTNATVLLQCMEPGCQAHAVMFFNPYYAQHGGTCLLRVDVQQTDFDGENGQVEIIEFLQVEGVNISEDISPGFTPCVAAYQGEPVPEADLVYNIVEEHDVTEAILSNPFPGTLRITGKISNDVDECGTPFLLDGIAILTCSPPPETAAEDEDDFTD